MLLLLKSFVCLQTCYVADLHLHISSNIPHRDLKQRNKKQRISHLEVVLSKKILSGGNFFATSRQQFACFGVETKHSIDSFYLKNQFIFSQSLLLPEDISCGFILLLEVICKNQNNCERCEMPIDVFGCRQQKYFNYFGFKDVV